MHPTGPVLGRFAVLAMVSLAGWCVPAGAAGPTTRAVAPRDPASLPPGCEPLTDASLHKERERLRDLIAQLQTEIGKLEAGAAVPAGATVDPSKPAPSMKLAPVPPAVMTAKALKGDDERSVLERENQSLRTEADALLLRLAVLEGAVPARPAAHPYNPRVIVMPEPLKLCPEPDVSLLERRFHYTATPIGQTDGQTVYEWVIAMTDESFKSHSIQSMLALVNGREVTGVAFLKQRLVIGPPPDRALPDRQPGERLAPVQPTGSTAAKASQTGAGGAQRGSAPSRKPVPAAR